MTATPVVNRPRADAVWTGGGWPGVALFLLAFGVLLGLVAARWAPLMAFDSRLSGAATDLLIGHPTRTRAATIVTDVGGPTGWWVVLPLLVVVLLWRRRVALAAYVAGTAALGGLLVRAVKEVVHRVRPELADPLAVARGFSFPSGHAEASAVGVALLLIVAWPVLSRRWRAVAVGLAVVVAVAVAASRVVLGVHYPSDVVGSWLLSLAWLAAAGTLLRLLLGAAGVRR